ncbi:hypothetical protein RclHR1_03750016 [Rhizophagus clarus]|uniref:Uncharacterized protein n=1 Tax=Rhizophagus clarus TaxID=94130 RepID=A0A2Z6S753_9GLOM|nr:hypothetical protein RclHR1_03750016 [Rhizophagus clarus]GET02463.1 hypothetical protein GLOIN_2v1539440 [Rhizophagus clarus]
MVERCCCCINLRLGTILISLIVLIQSMVGVWVAIHFIDSATIFSKALGYVHGIWNAIRGVMALGGLIGGIMQNQKLVKLFAVVISVSALFYLGFGITLSIITNKSRDKLVDMCLKKFSEQSHNGNYWSPLDNWSKPFDKRQDNGTVNVQPEQRELCQQAIKFYIGFAIAYTVIGFLLMFYFASVIGNYSGELKRKDMYNKVGAGSNIVEPEKPPRGIIRDI